MLRTSLSFLLLSIFCAGPNEGYKILAIIDQFSGSHVALFGSLADILVEEGHNVTMLIPGMNPLVKTQGSKLARIIRTAPDPDVVQEFTGRSLLKDIWTTKFNFRAMLQIGASHERAFTPTCRKINADRGLLNELKNEKFDLALIELFDACSIGLVEVLKIPAHVLASASVILDPVASLLGIPLFPSYVPSTFSKSVDSMTYAERFMNLIAMQVGQYFFRSIFDASEQLYKELYGKDFISFSDKVAQTTFFFTNMDPLLDFPRPITHKVVEVGGISVPEVKPLSKKWQKVVNLRSKIVVVSFGSVAQSQFMPPEMKTAMLKAFSGFPDVTFIWKYEATDLPLKDYPNVMLDAWLPQSDLLNQTNVRAVILHGGVNSVLEAAHRGKPMIAVPLFAEQNRNSNMIKRAGMGLVLQVADLYNDKIIAGAISRILNDPSYTENAQRLSKMIANRPISMRTLFVKHVEFAAEFGRIPTLDPLGRQMPFYSYFLLDIIVPFICILLVICTTTCYLFYRCVLALKNRKKLKAKTS